ncbi:hypothetical protein BZA05DRAFT_421740 [Tricharina praecox]|uniref:uncharacterized protein n=1 Tax=Tricharina praecox TaxID=43433 RepID=UPI00221EDEE0|nr:uncharacterized protein BZA05DRAFT_421740 [Tricharina praecox]KAI5844812.1 hypothetical protein BZA05DRAFT_421740 [Tricharina praecox]
MSVGSCQLHPLSFFLLSFFLPHHDTSSAPSSQQQLLIHPSPLPKTPHKQFVKTKNMSHRFKSTAFRRLRKMTPNSPTVIQKLRKDAAAYAIAKTTDDKAAEFLAQRKATSDETTNKKQAFLMNEKIRCAKEAESIRRELMLREKKRVAMKKACEERVNLYHAGNIGAPAPGASTSASARGASTSASASKASASASARGASGASKVTPASRKAMLLGREDKLLLSQMKPKHRGFVMRRDRN